MMKRNAILLGVVLGALIGTISCSALDPRQTVWKTTYIGHTYGEVTGAIKAGNVKSAVVDLDHSSGKRVALFLTLQDGAGWSLDDANQIDACLKTIDDYNAASRGSADITVRRETSYSAPTPASPGPSPTSHPRPRAGQG